MNVSALTICHSVTIVSFNADFCFEQGKYISHLITHPASFFNIGYMLYGTVFYWKISKTDFAQSSSNKCKNYLLKIYSQHINFFNTI